MHSLSLRAAWTVLLAVLCSGGAFLGLMNMADDPDIPGQSANASFQILQVASQFCEWWTPEPAVGTAVDGFGGDAGFLSRWGSSDEGSPDVPSAGSSRLLGLGISAAAAQRAVDAAAGDRKANFLAISTASLQLALLLDAAQQAGVTLWWAAWSTEEQGDAFDAQLEHVAGYVHLLAQTSIWDSPPLSSWAEPFLFDKIDVCLAIEEQQQASYNQLHAHLMDRHGDLEFGMGPLPKPHFVTAEEMLGLSKIKPAQRVTEHADGKEDSEGQSADGDNLTGTTALTTNEDQPNPAHRPLFVGDAPLSLPTLTMSRPRAPTTPQTPRRCRVFGHKGVLCRLVVAGLTMAVPMTHAAPTQLQHLVEATVGAFPALARQCNINGIVESMEQFGAGDISALEVLLADTSVLTALQAEIGSNAPPAFLTLLRAKYRAEFGSSLAGSSSTLASSSLSVQSKLMSVSMRKKGSQNSVVKPTVCNVAETDTFLAVYNALKPASFDDSVYELRCYLTRDGASTSGWPKQVETSLHVVAAADQFGANEIVFEFTEGHKSPFATPPASKGPSMYDKILESSRSKQRPKYGVPPLPRKAAGVHANRQDQLRVEVQEFFVGYGLSVAEANYPPVIRFLDDFTSLLWCINPHTDSLRTRGHLPHPALSGIFEEVWDDYKAKKQPLRMLCQASLNKHVGDLFGHIMRPWMADLHHSNVKAIVQKTTERLAAHVAYMEAQAKRSQGRYSELTVMEGQIKLAKFEASASPPSLPNKQHEAWTAIYEAMQHTAPYVAVGISEHLPSDRKHRWQVLQMLHMPVPVVLLTQTNNGRHPDTHYLMSLPPEPGSLEVIAYSQAMLGVYQAVREQEQRQLSRTAAVRFAQRWSCCVKLTPAVARGIVEDVTGYSVHTNGKDRGIDERLMALVESGDGDVVLDGRVCNGKAGESQFDIFWEKLAEVIGSWDVCGVDERRHGAVQADGVQVTPMAREISMRSLHKEAKDKCPKDAAVPTLRWMEYQMWPKNTLLKSAVQYTGRFTMTTMVQSRQLRKSHPDIIVGHVEFKYWREFCCDPRYRAWTDAVAEDDKRKVPVGEPGYPVAAAQNTRRVMVGKEQVLAAADHDFTRCNLIPSVALVIDIPNAAHESFYAGYVHVCLKNAILQPSNALRHLAETKRYFGASPKPIRMKYHDGGSDHKDTNGAVQKAAIIEFLADDLDYMVSMRCVPGQSFKDPAEHAMSVLNLCQQCTALDRQKMAAEEEAKIKNANSMAAIREVLENCENEAERQALTEGLELSMKPTAELLGGLYQKATFGGHHLQVHPPATEEAISELYEKFATVSPLTREQTSRKELSSDEELQAFCKDHVRFGLYKICIKKCDDPECKFHKPVRTPQATFETLTWFPDAMLDSTSTTSGWRSWRNCWGRSTTEKDYPSNQVAEKAKEDKLNSKVLHGKYVVAWVRCSVPSCRKPRCIFSPTALETDEKEQWLELTENTMFTCGAPVTMAGHPLHGHLFARASLSCSEPVEFDYYLHSNKFPLCCAWCGVDGSGSDGEPLKKDPTAQAQYRDVLPMCGHCEAQRLVAPRRYNKKFYSDKAAKKVAAATAAQTEAAEKAVADKRNPENVYDGPLRGELTKEQVEAFPKTCCRKPCLVDKDKGALVFQPNGGGAVSYGSNGLAHGVVQGQRCSKCKGMWHDLCCSSEGEGDPVMPFKDGACFDCCKAATAKPDKEGYTAGELARLLEGCESDGDEDDGAHNEDVLESLEEADLARLRATPRALFTTLKKGYVLDAAESARGGATDGTPTDTMARGGPAPGGLNNDNDNGQHIGESLPASDAEEEEPDQLDEDEYEVEQIIELVEGSKPMQWLVKWKGWPLDRDAESSYLLRSAFTTEQGHQMLLKFERERKVSQAAPSQKKRKTGAASSRAPPPKHATTISKRRGRGAVGGRKSAAPRGRGGKAVRGRGRGLTNPPFFNDSSDSEEDDNDEAVVDG